MSLGEIPLTPQALAQGSLISCSPGSGWKGHTHTHKGTCSASCNYGGGVPKRAALSGVSVYPAQPCSSPGRSGIIPLGQIPSSPTPDQPLLCSSPFSAQRPFPGVIPSSRVCPLSLVWCLQLWSPPQLMASTTQPRSASAGPAPQPWAIWMAPLGPPILSPRMPSPGLAQLSCPPFPHTIALPTLCP